jgi:hypothetical protein
MKSFLGILFALSLAPIMASEIGNSAMEFLLKIKDGNLNLEPSTDTALLAHTTSEKRALIAKQITKLKTDLIDAELELGTIKQDKEFAAVMIRKASGFPISHPQIFPIALVKNATEWKVAPLLATYENAVAGYTLPIRDRLLALESWMSLHRVTEFETWQKIVSKRSQQKIRTSIKEETLRGNDIGSIADAFIAHTKSGNRTTMLGYLGGLQETPPSDWAKILDASVIASQDPSTHSPAWRSLASPQVIQVRVAEEIDNNSGKVSYVCLDPYEAGKSGSIAQYRSFELRFSRDEGGLWMLHLPDSLFQEDDQDQLYEDTDIIDLFPAKLRKKHAATYAETPELAAENLRIALQARDPHLLFQCTHFGTSAKDGRIACGEALETWWSLHEPATLRLPIELGFKQEGDLAISAYQWFSLSDPARFNVRCFYFIKNKQGWIWSPGLSTRDHKQSDQAISKWKKSSEIEWQNSWKSKLTSYSVKLNAITSSKDIDDAEIKTLVDQWLSALKDKDLSAALKSTAWWSAEDSLPLKALRNISYEFANPAAPRSELSSIHRSGSWVAASVRCVNDQQNSYIFLPIVTTPIGARLLPEIDLRADKSRTRTFLNDASFKQIALACDENEFTDLRKLFSEFLADHP